MANSQTSPLQIQKKHRTLHKKLFNKKALAFGPKSLAKAPRRQSKGATRPDTKLAQTLSIKKRKEATPIKTKNITTIKIMSRPTQNPIKKVAEYLKQNIHHYERND